MFHGNAAATTRSRDAMYAIMRAEDNQTDVSKIVPTGILDIR